MDMVRRVRVKLTQQLVQKYMFYKDGSLYWRVPRRACRAGSEVGSMDTHGYRETSFKGNRVSLHRLIFLYHNGYLPENEIDHINRVRDDNRIENLREVTATCNQRNSKLFITNTSGVKGVSYCSKRKKWVAYINIGNKPKSLGRYQSLMEAACARLAAEQCVGWSACDAESTVYKYVMGG